MPNIYDIRDINNGALDTNYLPTTDIVFDELH